MNNYITYSLLKKLNPNDWNGKPFNAIVWDIDNSYIVYEDIKRIITKESLFIIDYVNLHWISADGLQWKYAAKFNEENINIITYYIKNIKYNKD